MLVLLQAQEIMEPPAQRRHRGPSTGRHGGARRAKQSAGPELPSIYA